jgi:hypothetical protein
LAWACKRLRCNTNRETGCITFALTALPRNCPAVHYCTASNMKNIGCYTGFIQVWSEV